MLGAATCIWRTESKDATNTQDSPHSKELSDPPNVNSVEGEKPSPKSRGFPRGSMVKDPPASAGNAGDASLWPLGWEDPLEKEMETHPSILAWRIP